MRLRIKDRNVFTLNGKIIYSRDNMQRYHRKKGMIAIDVLQGMSGEMYFTPYSVTGIETGSNQYNRGDYWV